MSDTVSSDAVAQDQLRAFIERIERLEDEKKAIADDIREVKAEAKGNGLSIPVLNEILKLRKKDHADRMEFEALLDLYMSALGMQSAPRDYDDYDEPPRRTANLSSGRAPSVSGSFVTTPKASHSGVEPAKTAETTTTPVRPDDSVNTDDEASHAPSSVSNSADKADDQSTAALKEVRVHGVKRDALAGKPSVPSDLGSQAAAGTQAPPVDTHFAIPPADQTTEVTPPASVVPPLQEGSEPLGAHNAEPAGSTPAPATPAPSIASVNEPPQSVANDANAGGDDARDLSKAGEAVSPHASPVAAPASVFSSKPRDGVYSADWLRRHGHCQQLETCAVEPGRLCRDCSLALAHVDAAE